MELSIAFMQVCSTCEASTRCGLKDEGLFDLCPKLKTLEKPAKLQVQKEATTALIDKEILRRYFGYSEFRQLQQDIILDVLKGNNVLVLMPTGGGKSLCYQYPSLLFKGLTVVVSPLISLMKNQVDSLRSNGIPAEYINSMLNYEEITKIKSALLQNKVREDIINQLELKECKKYIASFNRENLVYYVKPKHDALRQIVEFSRTKPRESGIIYCYSRKSVESLAENLKASGFRALPYHASLSARHKVNEPG